MIAGPSRAASTLCWRWAKSSRPALEAKGPSFPPGFLAMFCADAGRPELALDRCAAAPEANAQDWRIFGPRARLHLAAGRTDDAIADAAASLGLVYFQPAPHFLLGQAQGRLRQYEAAARSFSVAVSQAPGLLPAREALAETYARFLNKPEQAAVHRAQVMKMRDFRNITKVDPETIETLRPENRPVFPARPGANTPDARAPVIVVSGLPRSGTSMLMQALAAGGVTLLTDGKRTPDDDNPRGYNEFEPATRLADDSSWIACARGQAAKIVLPLLSHLPRGEAYRILLIQRELHEVLLSQAAMLQRLGRRVSTPRPRALAARYASQEGIVARFLARRPGIGVLPLDYAAVLSDPLGTARQIAAFLGQAFAEEACAVAIEPALRRQRA
jgi:tetratricopeptide (TPR) repeat protein